MRAGMVKRRAAYSGVACRPGLHCSQNDGGSSGSGGH